MTTNALARLVAWLVIAVAAAAAAPTTVPTDPTLHPIGDALAAGCIAGLGLFVVVARRRPPRGLRDVPARRLAARSLALATKSAQEEAVWRALVLGALVAPLGRVGALATSTALFACAHVPRQGRAAAVHLVSGCAFGAVYLATGRLVAAIAAHAAYNVLVGTSLLIQQTVSVSDTGCAEGAVVPSRSLPRRSKPTHDQAPPPPAAPVASLERVVKSFGDVDALAGVDLELRRGEILAVLGPNGAGKSTAVALLLGLRRPDRGRATLFGRDPRDPAARRHAGAVLQEVGFPPALRVREAVNLVRAHFASPEPADATLARLDLDSLADRDAIGLSGGQRRRLAVALALAGHPEALFLDEPTAGMDATARRALLADVAGFAASGGAVLLTTQQLAEAEAIATRVVVLIDGRVSHEGTVTEIRARAGLTRVTLRAPHLPDFAGIASVESHNGRHVLYVDDADRFVGDLVRSGVAFEALEVTPASLEDAFLALTSEEGTT